MTMFVIMHVYVKVCPRLGIRQHICLYYVGADVLNLILSDNLKSVSPVHLINVLNQPFVQEKKNNKKIKARKQLLIFLCLATNTSQDRKLQFFF